MKPDVKSLHIIQLTGGLGNQMFQYALYKELKQQGKNVKIEDESGYAAKDTREKHLSKAFHITYEKPTALEMELLTDSNMRFLSRVKRKLFGRKKKSYIEKQFNFDEQVFRLPCAYYEGCFQSEKYFTHVKEQLHHDFTFHCDIPEDSQKFLDLILQVNAVSLHIRRGDYLNPKQQELYGNICTESYYQEAISYMKTHVERPHFFLFTNDPQWAKENMENEDTSVVDCNTEETGYIDMYLMSRCRHHIIANSSFSWWGAWLNENPEKIVIAPKIWLNGRDCSDIYTKEMITISAD